MKKIVIFPYHPDIETLLQWLGELKDVSLYGVCSFKEDSIMTDRINAVLHNSRQMEEIMDQGDVLLILDNYRDLRNDKYYEVIGKAVELGKEVWIMPQIAKELSLDCYKGKYQILQKKPRLDIEQPVMYFDRKYPIDVPVIAVAGAGKNSGKFEAQLLINTYLEKEGYKSTWVSSNDLGCIFNSYSTPDFLYRDNYSFEKKIIQYNHFIHNLITLEEPDVLLIGIPEGIAAFEVKETNHFSEYPLVIGNAVSIDSAALCMYYMNVNNRSAVKEICDFANTRFSIPVDVFYIGRNTFEEDEVKNELTFSFLDEGYLERHYTTKDSVDDSIYCLWKKDAANASVKRIIEKLQSNIDAL